MNPLHERFIRSLMAALLLLLCISIPIYAQRNSMIQNKYVTIYGQKIHYLEAGSGPYLILLHAVGADASEWTRVIEPLAQHYHVIAPDQVGFGQSDKPYVNYRMQT